MKCIGLFEDYNIRLSLFFVLFASVPTCPSKSLSNLINQMIVFSQRKFEAGIAETLVAFAQFSVVGESDGLIREIDRDF